MKPTLSIEMHTFYTGAIYLKAVMAFHTGHSLMRTLQTWVVETWRQLTLIIINGETGNYQKLNLAQLTANYCSRTERFNQNHSHVHLCLKCTVKKLKRLTFHKPPCSPGLCLAVMAIKQRTALISSDIREDPWHSHVMLASIWQWNRHYFFIDLGQSQLGFLHPIFRMLGEH